MSQSNQNMEKNRSQRFLTVVPVIFLCILAALFLGNALSAPKKKLNRIHQHYADTSGSCLFFRNDSLDQAVLKAQKDIAFYTSRLAMAKSDSICVSVNLEDSILNLEIRGVVVHQAGIATRKVNLFFSRIDPCAVRNLFSKPFILKKLRGNGPQNPVLVKKAPKDTIEAAKISSPPDTSRRKPVFFTAELENGFTIYIEQYDRKNLRYHLARTCFLTRHRLITAVHTLADLFRLRITDYKPLICLQLSHEDARALYRSLPRQALFSLRI